MIIIPEQQPPRGMSDDVKFRLHWMELMHRAEVRASMERAERERSAEAEYQAVLWRDLLN